MEAVKQRLSNTHTVAAYPGWQPYRAGFSHVEALSPFLRKDNTMWVTVLTLTKSCNSLLILLLGFEIVTRTGEKKLVGVDEYLQHMEKDGVWGDGVMISAATLNFGRHITVISATTKQPINDFKCNHSTDANCPNVSARKEPEIFLGLVSFATEGGGMLDHYVSLTADNSSSVSRSVDPSKSESDGLSTCQSDCPSMSQCSSQPTTLSTSQSSDTIGRDNGNTQLTFN